MKTISLCGKWRMTGGGFDCEGQVPGSLYSFLLDAGLMEDPYYRDNEYSALALTDNDYTFEKRFDFSGGDSPCLLRFEGLDTFCDVYLNGEFIAHTDDMHVTYEFDVTDKLLVGENVLRVICHEIHTYRKQKAAELDLHPTIICLIGHAYIRKAHCMLGWDWGPFLPDMGIWRGVYLVVCDSARIVDLSVTQRHDEGRVYITPHVMTDGEADISVSITAPDGSKYTVNADEEWEVPSPQLWWPRGLGEQPLYEVKAVLTESGAVCDEKQIKIGLRTLRLIREKDRWGESFMHECNGVRFFAMGADYIPEDNIFSRCTAERTEKLLRRCVEANFNTVRVWGGGYYPDNYFFEICDKLGLVVFLDLAFACTLYNPSDHDIEVIKIEVEQNLRRLRHHPSLALISGNNEVEACNIPEHLDEKRLSVIPANIELFEGVIAEICARVCPDTAYIHTSPVTVGRFIDPNNENFGDSHYWGVWHGTLPFTEYRRHYFRYLSEFGFQSFPSYKTIEAITLPEDRNVFSRVMEMHQRNAGANSKIVSYISQTFLYPTSFETLIYASQLLQAEAIKYGAEHLRRNRGRCMGALYWQLNDIWPVASWSSIDYYGRLKALHYYAKRFYSPLLISCEETGETATRPFVIMEPGYYDYETKARLVVTNDTLNDVSATVRAYLRTAEGTPIKSYEWSVSLPAMSPTQICDLDFEKTDVLNNYFSYELCVGDEVVSEGAVLFCAPKHFRFRDPHLSLKIEGDEIVICADSFARSVEIYSPDCDLVLSDNFFDLHAAPKRIKILEGTPKTVLARSVYDIR